MDAIPFLILCKGCIRTFWEGYRLGAPLQVIREVGLGGVRGKGIGGPGATHRSGRIYCSAFFPCTHWMVVWLQEGGFECRRRCFHRRGQSDLGHAFGYNWWLSHRCCTLRHGNISHAVTCPVAAHGLYLLACRVLALLGVCRPPPLVGCWP